MPTDDNVNCRRLVTTSGCRADTAMFTGSCCRPGTAVSTGSVAETRPYLSDVTLTMKMDTKCAPGPCLPSQHELQRHYQQDSENDPYCACSVRSLTERTAHKFCNDSFTSYPRFDSLTWLTPGAPHFPEPSKCRLTCCLNPALHAINH